MTTTPVNRQKVLHFITCLGDGGAQSCLAALCVSESNCEHLVVSLSDHGKYGPLLEAKGVSVASVGMKRGRFSLSGLWRMWRLVRRERPHAVQTWMYHADLLGGIVARLSGLRNVVWGIRHTTLVPGESPRSTIVVAWLCARLSRLVPRRIVCCAEKAREVHAGIGYDPARMVVIPNGYDLSVFSPDVQLGRRLRHELSLSPSEPVIGFVARFDPQKDHDNLLRALAVLHEKGDCPVCLLVGTGLEPGNAALKDRIATLGLSERVHLLGRRDDIPAVMNALDVHVMSSAFGEAFPNVLAEAMACGTPCVSTDVGDAAAIVGDTGRIVPPRDPHALAAAIAQMLLERDRPEWSERCEAARRRVSDSYSIEKMVESYQNVWIELDDGNAPSGVNMQARA